MKEVLRDSYLNDPEFSSQIENPTPPFRKDSDMLYMEKRLCVPKGKFRSMLLHDYHTTPSTGHLGRSKTLKRIKDLYYWKSMKEEVYDFVRTCKVCQMTKSQNQRPFGFLQPINPPETKWQVITMDFITPLPTTKNGKTGILNVVCKLSKMIRLISLPKNTDAHTVARLFKQHVYRNHGLPSKIISDRDSIFMSKFWKSLFTSLGTKLSPSSAYHPQTDGQTEIANRKVEEMIRAFANFRKDNWDEHLVDFEVAYNSAVHSTTLCTPFFINYGIHPRTIPLETLATDNPTVDEFLQATVSSAKFSVENIHLQNERMAEYANRSRRDHQFKVGDYVWLSTKNLSIEDGSGIKKLHPKFCGPFLIKEKINDVCFKLELSEAMRAKRIHDSFHVSLLKPYEEDPFKRSEVKKPEILFPDGHVEYEVENILSHRTRQGKIQYLVKWKGYPDHENTWEVEENLENCSEILHKYQCTAEMN